MPPAMRKAGIEMPMKPSTASPRKAKSVRMANAVMQARQFNDKVPLTGIIITKLSVPSFIVDLPTS